MVSDLGERPAPQIQPAEPPPGGVDAVTDALVDTPPQVPDLAWAGNEPAKDEVPREVTEPDETDVPEEPTT